jgi:hypothetical protein
MIEGRQAEKLKELKNQVYRASLYPQKEIEKRLESA